MTRRSSVRTLTTTGLLLAVGLLLPMVLHSLFGAAGGRTLLPMHYAVVLGGLLLGPVAGAFLGIATPLLSTLMTGMPAVAILPPMVIELTVLRYGCRARTPSLEVAVLWSLLIAMVRGGRIGSRSRPAWTVYWPEAEPVAYVLGGMSTVSRASPCRSWSFRSCSHATP